MANDKKLVCYEVNIDNVRKWKEGQLLVVPSAVNLTLVLMDSSHSVSKGYVSELIPSYWEKYLEPRMKEYHGRISISPDGRRVDLLDLSEEEKEPGFPYEDLRTAVSRLEREVSDLRKQVPKGK